MTHRSTGGSAGKHTPLQEIVQWLPRRRLQRRPRRRRPRRRSSFSASHTRGSALAPVPSCFFGSCEKAGVGGGPRRSKKRRPTRAARSPLTTPPSQLPSIGSSYAARFDPETRGSGSSGTGPHTYSRTRAVASSRPPREMIIPTGSCSSSLCIAISTICRPSRT